MNSFETDPFCWWSLLVIDWIYFIYKQRPIQVVCFFLYEFWQLCFQGIGPYHVDYLICDHRVVHSIVNYSFNVYGEVFISTSLLKDSFAEYRILGWYFLFSVNFISWDSLLACLFVSDTGRILYDLNTGYQWRAVGNIFKKGYPGSHHIGDTKNFKFYFYYYEKLSENKDQDDNTLWIYVLKRWCELLHKL